jgi:hypothetical protein
MELLTEILTELIEGHLRRAGVPLPVIDEIIGENQHTRQFARWLIERAPELHDEVIDDCLLEM